MKAYFLSGLGADERVFRFLQLPSHVQQIHLPWLIPSKKETFKSYARRMADKIDTNEPFYLVGLSFGGMLATEILKFVSPQKTFFISTVLTRKELPWYFRLYCNKICINLLPEKMLTYPNPIFHALFGANSKQEKEMLDRIVKEADPTFCKWAITQIFAFNPDALPKQDYIRIHGSTDKILPIHHFIPSYTILHGSHFMIANRADEISIILEKEMNI
jgi:hypothetical protein